MYQCLISLHKDEVREAYQLIKDLEPAVPQEYNLKGVVNAALGQGTGSVSIFKHILLPSICCPNLFIALFICVHFPLPTSENI